MGWSGISLIALRPGETADEAVNRTTAAWMEGYDDGNMVLVGNEDQEDTEPSDETDAWIERIVELLRAENPRLEIIDDQRDDAGHRRWVTLDDEDGPVVIYVYRDEVQLEPGRGYQNPEDQPGAGFHVMWRYCQLLAGEGCIAYDPDYDEHVNLDLDEDEARGVYNWI